MKYVIVILLSFLCSFMIVGCPNKDRSEEVAQKTVSYFKRIGDKNIKYVLYNSPSFQANLIYMRENTPEEDWKEGEKRVFQSLKGSRWATWQKIFDGTKINIVGYQRTEKIYKTSLKSGMPVRSFPELSKEAYTVSLQLIFTKKESAIVQNGIFLKKIIFEVHVYYDGERYLIDLATLRRLHAGDELWLE